MKFTAEQMVTTTQEFKELSFKRRSCLYPNEKDLKLFDDYSKSSCILECSWKSAIKACNCYPWYLGNPELLKNLTHTNSSSFTNICDMHQLGCFDKNVRQIMTGDRMNQCTDVCPPDFEMVTYSTQYSTSMDFQLTAFIVQRWRGQI